MRGAEVQMVKGGTGGFQVRTGSQLGGRGGAGQPAESDAKVKVEGGPLDMSVAGGKARGRKERSPTAQVRGEGGVVPHPGVERPRPRQGNEIDGLKGGGRPRWSEGGGNGAVIRGGTAGVDAVKEGCEGRGHPEGVQAAGGGKGAAGAERDGARIRPGEVMGTEDAEGIHEGVEAEGSGGGGPRNSRGKAGERVQEAGRDGVPVGANEHRGVRGHGVGAKGEAERGPGSGRERTMKGPQGDGAEVTDERRPGVEEGKGPARASGVGPNGDGGIAQDKPGVPGKESPERWARRETEGILDSFDIIPKGISRAAFLQAKHRGLVKEAGGGMA